MEPYIHPTPQFIRLGQFVPSEVYFVEELFEDRGEKLIHGFRPTIEKTLLIAQEYRQVDPGTWNLNLTIKTIIGT